jgi:hypothetical protein
MNHKKYQMEMEEFKRQITDLNSIKRSIIVEENLLYHELNQLIHLK